MNAEVTWKDGMAFDAAVDGFNFTVDAAAEHGGQGLGPRPKALTLIALAGCTGMDVVAILGKMRVAFDGLRIGVEAKIADEHPKRFVEMIVTYDFTGTALPAAKLLRAVSLSEERYCGVKASLQAVRYRSVVRVNGEVVQAVAAAAAEAAATA